MTEKRIQGKWFWVGNNIACVAGGIVGVRKIKFWRQSRQKHFKVPLPILLAASPLACRLRRQNFISRALTIPPAMQARNNMEFEITKFELPSSTVASEIWRKYYGHN